MSTNWVKLLYFTEGFGLASASFDGTINHLGVQNNIV